MITHGFFGKIPTTGDFIGRGWRSGAREGLDRLLQQAIATLLSSSENGKEAMLQAPYVMLSIRPGVVGEQGVEVAVLPSQDRVGRVFPLCAGVQWTDDGQGGMGWPSLDYGRALIGAVQRGVDAGADPDSLLSEIVAVGSPRQFPATFAERSEDETVPRLPAGSNWLKFQGPQAAIASSTAALCGLLQGRSDLLGVRFDDRGEAGEFFACRRYDSGEPLAALFDGRWAERDWFSLDVPTAPTAPAAAPAAAAPAAAEVAASADMSFPAAEVDEDETRPRHRVIDTGKSGPDSPAAS